MQLRDSIPVWLRLPRSTLWLIVAAVLVAVIALSAPHKSEVTTYKVSLIALAAVLAYWLDRAFFPYSRPDSYLVRDWRLGSTEPTGAADHPVVPGYELVFAAAMIRRAIVIAAVVTGVAMGL